MGRHHDGRAGPGGRRQHLGQPLRGGLVELRGRLVEHHERARPRPASARPPPAAALRRTSASTGRCASGARPRSPRRGASAAGSGGWWRTARASSRLASASVAPARWTSCVTTASCRGPERGEAVAVAVGEIRAGDRDRRRHPVAPARRARAAACSCRSRSGPATASSRPATTSRSRSRSTGRSPYDTCDAAQASPRSRPATPGRRRRRRLRRDDRARRGGGAEPRLAVERRRSPRTAAPGRARRCPPRGGRCPAAAASRGRRRRATPAGRRRPAAGGCGQPGLAQPPVADADDAVGDACSAAVVADEDERRAGLGDRGGERVVDVGRGLGVQLAGRLVREHQRRPVRQRRADRDPLRLAAGQRVRPARGQMPEPQPVERRERLLVRVRRDRPASRRCSATLASTSSSGRSVRRGSWSTRPRARERHAASSRADAPVGSRPATVAVPADSRRSPERTPSSVVLPDPLGPWTTTRSPGATVSVIPRSAATAPPPGSGWRQKASRTSTTGDPAPADPGVTTDRAGDPAVTTCSGRAPATALAGNARRRRPPRPVPARGRRARRAASPPSRCRPRVAAAGRVPLR